MPPRQPLPAPRPTPNATPKPPKVQGPKTGLKPARNRTPTHFGMNYYDPFNPLTNNQIGTMAHHTAQQQLNALLGAIPSAQTVSQPYQQAITGVQGLSGALGKDLGQVGQQAQASAVQNANATATGQNRAAILSGSGQSFQADPAFAQQMALTQQAQQAAAAQAGTIHALDFNTKMANALVARQNDVNAAKAKEPAYETAATQALQDQQFKAQTVRANLQLAQGKAATSASQGAARIAQGAARIKLEGQKIAADTSIAAQRLGLARQQVGIARQRLANQLANGSTKGSQNAYKAYQAAYRAMDPLLKGSAGSNKSASVTVSYYDATGALKTTKIPPPPGWQQGQPLPASMTGPQGSLPNAKVVGYTPAGGGGSGPNTARAIQRGLAVLRQMNSAYGFGWSDTQMQKAVTGYAGGISKAPRANAYKTNPNKTG